MTRNISIKDISAIVTDFDGVLTDNKVYISSSNNEMVRCCRSDGLAFDALRKLRIKSFILSSESNSVVTRRAEKLKIPVLHGSLDKATDLKALSKEHQFDLESVIYVGNDINDLAAMSLCGYRCCPSDSHPAIKNISTNVLGAPGGEGVIRELVEQVLNINLCKILYK